MILLSALSWRLFQIQLFDRQHYAASANKAFHRVERLPAIRGMIVDRNQDPIAKSIPVSSVFIDKKHLNDQKLTSFGLAYMEASSDPLWHKLSAQQQARQVRALRGEILSRDTPEQIYQKHLSRLISLLAQPLELDPQEMRATIQEHRSKWFVIAKDIPDDVAETLRETVSKNYLQGIIFENSLKRWYTNPNLATHLTGFTGEQEMKDESNQTIHKIKGRFGIESSMEEFLVGKDGKREHHRDSRGMLIPGKEDSLTPPTAGLNVQLTLDLSIQAIVEEELDAGLAEFVSEQGAVIVMNPKNGEILAMASRPHFNLNDKKNLKKASFNYAIQGKFEPGSTIKIIPTAAAIEEKIASLNTTLFCPPFLQEQKFTVRDTHSSGMLSLEKIIQKSNNVGCWKLAKQLGATRYYQYVHAFGFGKKTGIPLSGENTGNAPLAKLPIDFSRSAYGYFINVTPLQMAAAYSVIAGNGEWIKPQIIKALIANDGTVVEEFPPEYREKVISENTVKLMRHALHQVTLEGGTAQQAVVPGFKVCGKTGTAVKHDPARGGYVANAYVNSFAGFMPADDPAFVCYVVIDEPKTKKVRHYGGTIAAPIFSKIATRISAYLNLPPTETLPDHESKVVKR